MGSATGMASMVIAIPVWLYPGLAPGWVYNFTPTNMHTIAENVSFSTITYYCNEINRLCLMLT